MNRRRILILVMAATVCFAVTSLLPLGRSPLRMELVARTLGEGGWGSVTWAEPGTAGEEESLALAPLDGRFQLCVADLPLSPPSLARLTLEPVGRQGVSFLVSDLRFSCRHGPFNRLWSIDPGALPSSDHLTVRQVKPGLWHLSAPTGVPRITLDLARHQPVIFLRAETGAWFLFWTLLVLLILGLSNGADRIPVSRLLVYTAALLLIACQGWSTMQTVPYGVPPDELAHVSYLIHLKETGRAFPDYQSRYLYSERGAELDHRNYLAHPPFYYNLLKPFVPNGPRLIASRFQDLRLVNLALGLCGVALFFWVGCREPLPLAFHIYYAAAFSAMPMIPYLAGSVNNDNLLLIAGSLAVYGAILFLGSNPRGWGLPLLGGGLCLALLVKATAGLQLLFLVGMVLALRISRDRSIGAFRGFRLPVFAVICLIPLAYYLWAYATYATFIPQFGKTWYDLAEEPVILSFFQYARHFFRVFALSWTGILSHESVFRVSLVSALPLLLPLGLAFWALFLREKRGESPFFTVHRLAFVSLLLMMAFHFTQVYRYHLTSGYPGGMQARYYLALMPCVLMLSFRPFANSLHRPLVRICLGLLVGGLVAGTIWFNWFRPM